MVKNGICPQEGRRKEQPTCTECIFHQLQKTIPTLLGVEGSEELPVPNEFGVAGGKVLHKLGGHSDFSSCSGPDTVFKPSQYPGSPQTNM